MLKERIIKFLKLDGLLDALSGYAEARVELLKVEIKEDVTRLLAKALVWLVISLMAALFLLLVSFAGAYAIAEDLGLPWGFTTIAGFYLVLAILCLLFRKDIQLKIEKRLEETMQKKSDDNGTTRDQQPEE